MSTTSADSQNTPTTVNESEPGADRQLSRRGLITAAVATAVSTTGVTQAWSAVAQVPNDRQTNGFAPWDQTVYVNVDLQQLAGIGRSDVAYAGQFSEYTDNGELPPEAEFKNYLQSRIHPSTPGPLVLDLERMQFDVDDDDLVQVWFDICVTIVGWARETLAVMGIPGRQLGMWGAGNPGRWLPKYRDLFAQLAALFDLMCPSGYTDNPDIQFWVNRIDAALNVLGQHAPGKPVLPYIWPQYWNQGAPHHLEFIPGQDWRFELDTLLAHPDVDGLVIWSKFSERDKTSPNAPWVLQTIDFMNDN